MRAQSARLQRHRGMLRVTPRGFTPRIASRRPRPSRRSRRLNVLVLIVITRQPAAGPLPVAAKALQRAEDKQSFVSCKDRAAAGDEAAPWKPELGGCAMEA